MNKWTLLAVFAHPDDEAYSIGGTLSRYAADGHGVYLVTATRGEAGEIRDPALATKTNLPQVREKELRCACEAYGIHAPRFLDYMDGQLAAVHQGQAVGKLVRVIRELRPQVMITYGPEGIYGHYDHIAVHRWAAIAFDLAADPGCFPDAAGDACAPHQVNKLYYTVLTEDVVHMMSPQGKPASVMMDGVPFPFVGYRRDQLSAIIDVKPYVTTKLRGLLCHATQFDVTGEAEEWLESPLFCEEVFLLGRTTLDPPKGMETDLLTGLH